MVQLGFWKRFWNYKFINKKKEEIVILPEAKVEVIKPVVEYKFIEAKSNPHEIIVIEPYEPFKVHDLANMFPFNITPALIESKIQHAIAAKQSMLNRLTPQFVIMFIMILIAAVLAFIMIWKFTGQANQEVIVKLAPGLQSAGIQAEVLTNLTG